MQMTKQTATKMPVKKESTTASVVHHQPQPMELLKLAIEKDADVEKLQKLLDLQKDWEANEARKAYNHAIAEFKKNPPVISKNKTVSYTTSKGETKYNHASLDHVVEIVAYALSEHGLSHSWRTGQNDKGQVTVTCVLSHALGHSEETPLSSSPDTSGNKNNIQGIGSAVTYLERYTLLAITGLATTEQDDDDGEGTTTFITEQQQETLKTLLKETSSDYAKFLGYMAVDKLEEIKESQFNKAMAAIAAKRNK